jgi:hypothetical protein
MAGAMPRILLVALCAFWCASLSCGGGGGEWDVRSPEEDVAGCGAVSFPEVDVEGTVYFVAPCGTVGASGTREDPFATLAEAVTALDKAGEPGTLLLAPGGHAVHNLFYSRPISLYGSGSTGADRTVLVTTGKEHALELMFAHNAVLQGFAIEGDAACGIFLNNCSGVQVRNVRIDGVGRQGVGAGLKLDGSTDLVLGGPSSDGQLPSPDGLIIENVDGYGIQAEEALFTLEGSVIQGAQKGGVHAVESASIGQRYEAKRNTVIRGNRFVDNVGFGISLDGGTVVLEGNEVVGTVAPDDYTLAPCLVVGPGGKRASIILATDNLLEGCQGEGLRLTGSAWESQFQGNTVRNTAGAGIWMEEEARALLTDNTIESVHVAGLFLAQKTNVRFYDNTINGVSVGHLWGFPGGSSHPHAFGIAVHRERSGGDLEVTGNTVTGCELAGVVLHGPLPEHNKKFEGNVVVGNVDAGVALEAEAVGEELNEGFADWFAFSSPELGVDGNGPTGSENLVVDTAYLPD